MLGCTVCYGDPSSPLTKGAEAGVLVLAGVIGIVLLGFASLFLYWMRRAKQLERALAAAQEVTPIPSDANPLPDVAPYVEPPAAPH
jgi:hypothetical protein